MTNFSATDSYGFDLDLPESLIAAWNLKQGSYNFKDQFYKQYGTQLVVLDGKGKVRIDLKPLESFIFSLNNKMNTH